MLLVTAAPLPLGAQTAASAPAPGDSDVVPLDSLMARPPSPGGLLLLLPHSSDARVQRRWSDAARHENPGMRAAAARAIHASGLVPLLPDVRHALDAEEDTYAAIEQARALIALGDANAVDVAIAAAHRLEGRLPGIVMGALALKAPDDLLARAPALRGLGSSGGLGAALALAASRKALEQRGTFAAAARAAGPHSWAAFLDFNDRRDISLARSALIQALDDSSPDIVRRAMWSLGELSPSAEILGAFDRALERLAEPRSPEAFLRVLLGRHIHEKAREEIDWPTAIRAWPKKRAESMKAIWLANMVSKAERKAFAKALDVDDWPGFPIPKSPAQPPGETVPLEPPLVLRTPAAFPRLVVSDAMGIVGCAASDEAIAAADVDYRADGRPRRVRPVGQGTSPACDQVFRALMAASVAPINRPLAADRAQVIVMSFRPEPLACADQYPPYEYEGFMSAPKVGTGEPGTVQPPVKTYHVSPVYPEALQRAGIQGQVVIEAIISRGGCVSLATVSRSPHPRLSLAAVTAVTQWRFSPTLLNGSPVPVIMTVTANFALK